MSLKRFVILLLTLALTVGCIGCGKSKNTTSEVQKEETAKKEETENKEGTEKKEKKPETTDDASDDVVTDGGILNDAEKQDEVAPNTTTGATGKNDTPNRVTPNKPTTNQTVTKPTPSHVHAWTEVKTQVAVPEIGHYEKVQGWVKFCTVCNVNMDDWTNEEIDAHTFGDECPGKFTMDCKTIGEKWVVDTPATTELRVTGYKCSCGATREKTQYAGMYSNYDKASWDRLEACHQFFKKGLAGEGTQKSKTYLSYGNWDSVVVSNGSTDGAWMWIFIREWKLDDYSYLQDGVKEGIIDQEEAKLVEAIYEEIPSIFKGAIERVAPEGGTELYNYVEKLIIQTGGDPDAVPNLSGAKGNIPENIPGLYVTIEETRGGFSLMFWAE